VHHVEIVDAHPDQAAFDAVAHSLARPVLPDIVAGHVPGLGRQDELVAPAGDGAADEFLAGAIAGSGVQEVDAVVQGGGQKEGGGLLLRQGQFAHLRKTQAQAADDQAGFAQFSLFHFSRPSFLLPARCSSQLGNTIVL